MSTDPRVYLSVACGAALGGLMRLILTQFVVSRFGGTFGTYATMFINVSGSFLIGIVIEMSQTRAGFDPMLRFFLATGVLGGYTTFSTFSYEAFILSTTGSTVSAAIYVIGSVALGILGALGGIATAKATGG